MYSTCMQLPSDAKTAVGSSRAGVTSSCELMWVLKTEHRTQILYKSSEMLLNTELSGLDSLMST